MVNRCSGTPKITVRDNRGLTVRKLRYNRSQVDAVATQYVDAQRYNELGQLTVSQDARFFADGKGTLNFEYTPALSGQVLQTISADAGTSQTFADIEGRPIWQQDARDTTQTFAYDALGRPLSRTETLDGQSPAVRERWGYGDVAPPPATYNTTDQTDPRNLNQRGQPVQHYDTAGLLDVSTFGYTVQGAAQQQVRRLLPPETPSDWTSGTAADWQTKLESGNGYPTAWAYNAVGQVLTQTDARGHRQRSAYDVAGRKHGGWVTPKGLAERSVTTAITYMAGGEIETKADANGITTTYTYEPQTTQRVLEIKVTRKQGTTTAVLQDLSYTYDPVGNLAGMTDAAAQIAYFNNQATTAARAYTYDALYQLLSGTGRENAVSSTPANTDNPAASAPPVPDPVNYRSYSRSYTYDLGGNLTGITPGNSASVRTMTVAAASNRAVSNLNATNVTAATVGKYFDAAGNATCLDGNTNQPMYWSGLNQLQSLVTMPRSATDLTQNDRESYAYGGDGHRVRKTGFAKASGGNWNQSDAIYLPGLEIRTSPGETLEVIVLDDGARVLNWTQGQPDVPNQQIRYRYADRQNSCQIETDENAQIITQEEYYPYGGTSVWAAASTSEAKYKTIRYSGKERDAAGLYYYGMRYYQPWIGRWINPDPAGTVDGLNLYCMVGNNPATLTDADGLMTSDSEMQYTVKNINDISEEEGWRYVRTPDWPAPENRWSSFEAEGFPVTAYRYDSRNPTDIEKAGFVAREVPPMLIHSAWPTMLFGKDTIFGAFSRAGVDRFLNEDKVSVFNSREFGAIGPQWDRERKNLEMVAEFFKNTPRAFNAEDKLAQKRIAVIGNESKEYLYKIKSDTNKFYPLKDFASLYGKRFAQMIVNQGRSFNNSRANDPSKPIPSIKDERTLRETYSLLGGAHSNNDEVHLHGPISARAVTISIGGRPLTALGRDIKFVKLEHLDLAVPL